MTTRSTSEIVVAPNSRVIRYKKDAVGNDLTAVLRWCSTHLEPAWEYNDGSLTCPHELVVGWSPNEHVIVDAPWEGSP